MWPISTRSTFVWKQVHMYMYMYVHVYTCTSIYNVHVHVYTCIICVPCKGVPSWLFLPMYVLE